MKNLLIMIILFLTIVFDTNLFAYDPYYSDQRNLNKIKVEQAWDVTTGSSDIIVPV